MCTSSVSFRAVTALLTASALRQSGAPLALPPDTTRCARCGAVDHDDHIVVVGRIGGRPLCEECFDALVEDERRHGPTQLIVGAHGGLIEVSL